MDEQCPRCGGESHVLALHPALRGCNLEQCGHVWVSKSIEGRVDKTEVLVPRMSNEELSSLVCDGHIDGFE